MQQEKNYQFNSFLLALAFLGIVAVALLLSGCGPIEALAAPLETPVIAAGVMAVSETPPTETATPQPTATATNVPDYSGLWPSQTAIAIRQQEIGLTQSALQLIGQANDISNAAGNATATMRAIYTGTAQADVYATQTQMPLDATATVSARAAEIALDKSQAEAERDLNIGYVWGIAKALIAVAVIYVLCYLFALRGRQVMTPQQPEPDADSDFLDNISHDVSQVNVSSTEVYLHEIDITRDEKATLRRAVIELNGRLSRPTVTPRYFSDPRWREIDAELCKPGFAKKPYAFHETQNGPMYLTDEGYRWLGLTPPASPQGEKSPETSENPDETKPNQPKPTGGVAGEGDSYGAMSPEEG